MPSAITASRVSDAVPVEQRERAAAWSRSVGLRAAGVPAVPTSDQRPAASGGPSDGQPPGRGRRRESPRRPLPAQRPQRRERVVRDLAGPDEVPQRVEDLAVRTAAARRREQLAVERGAARGEVLADRVVAAAPAGRLDAVRQARPAAGPRGPAGRARSGRRRGRGCRARPRRPRRARPARRAAAAGSRGCGPAARRAPARTPGSARPASWSTTSARRSSAARPAERRRSRRPTGGDALPGRQEPRRAPPGRPARPRAGAGPASAAGACRRTSGSHHSRSAPPGRNSPRSSVPAASSRSSASSTTPIGRPQRARRLGRQERAVGPGLAGEQPVERAPSPGRGTPPGRRPAATTPTPSR